MLGGEYYHFGEVYTDIVIMDKMYFWFIYIIMCLILIVTVYYDIVKPLMREEDSVSRGTRN